ncbi:heat shock 70 kDa protein 12A-like [Dreissena polymorpha]|nr:heat shock 70 kDa protein 12A-like [Dreissena polymorpha]
MVAFGEDAKTLYHGLVKTQEYKSWYLFELFKMALFVQNKPLEKNIMIEDILGNKMKAVEIFSLAIEYIKTEVINTLTDETRMNKATINVMTDIHWVLTVPAIWNDLSKKFMRDAATRAGIPDEMLTLALEPEAASLFCKEQLGVGTLPSGHRYMVLDLGGGTADITVHQVNDDGTLSEIHQPTGGDFGGTNVDNKFVGILVQIFGADIFQKFKKDCMDEYLDFMQNFEIKKRNFDGSTKLILRFPIKLREMYEQDVGASVESSVNQTLFGNKLEFILDKLVINVELAKTLFDEAVGNIVRTVEELMVAVKPIYHILLVGGFSESPYLQSVMRKTFDVAFGGEAKVIIPNEPSLAVVHGAVLYCLKPFAIAARVCKYTYGIARLMRFEEGHPDNKKVRIGDKYYCDDIFNKHIEIGTQINIANAEIVKAQTYYPSRSDMKQAVLEVYASPHKDPKYIDENGCQFVGLIKLDIDPKGDMYSELLVKLMFGGTELRIQVTDVKQNIVTNACVDFLG